MLRRSRPKKKRPSIDKSILPFGCKMRFEDPKYLKSFKGCTCFACKIQDETIVGAHIRPGWYGRGKPHDYWVMPLCSKCHALEESNSRKFYAALGYTIRQIKHVAHQRYRSWLNG